MLIHLIELKWIIILKKISLKKITEEWCNYRRMVRQQIIKIKIKISVLKFHKIKINSNPLTKEPETALRVFNRTRICQKQTNKKKIDPLSFLIQFLNQNNKILLHNNNGNKAILKTFRPKENSNKENLKIKQRIKISLIDSYKKKLI